MGSLPQGRGQIRLFVPVWPHRRLARSIAGARPSAAPGNQDWQKPVWPAGQAPGFGLALLLTVMPGHAFAHAADQPFVLLLPTGLYISAGIAAVILTLILIAIPRIGALTRSWQGRPVMRLPANSCAISTSLASLAILATLVLAGLSGSTDPVANPLPLFFWVFWWIILVLGQALVGDLWRWLNPWTGAVAILRRLAGRPPPLRLPAWLGAFPAIALFLGFALFLAADLAPTDPRRLARVVCGYWLFSFVGMLLFGSRRWLAQCEFVTIFMRRFAGVAPLACKGGRILAGVPGWQLLRFRRPGMSLGLFVIAMLSVGSFESLYGTFWWLTRIGINPLEFPGRSVIFWSTLWGLLGACLLAAAAFAAMVGAGLWLAGEGRRFGEAFCRQAQCLLPIAVGYHFAHYLTSLLVDGQYLYAAMSDPFGTGADLLGIGHFHVTTGFLTTRDSVEVIWLSQAGAVVAGHVLAILVSHGVALDMFGEGRKTMLSQLPISAFMVAYTFFGLWLLASPRGM